MHTSTLQPPRGGNDAGRLARIIAFLEAMRTDSVAQRDLLAPAGSQDLYAGRVQAFDLALGELRDFAGEVAA